MITIGNTYLIHKDGQVRLCADLTLNGKGTTLWFGVDEAYGEYLCHQRSDAFVMALLPTAMRGGYEIVCETPMSERLHYQLSNYLIPTLSDTCDIYHSVKIRATLTADRIPTAGAVGTGFSGGVDCLYTILTHGKDNPLPLTHVAVFNTGVFEGPAYREAFKHSCRNAQRFSEESGMPLVCVDSNISEVLPERYLDVFSYRLCAFALALQPLFSVYLLSSSYDASVFYINPHACDSYNALLIHCAQTETLTVYHSGSQAKRLEKTKALSAFPIAYRWFHPCIYGHVGERNCGHCRKCIREGSILYAMGKLDLFEAVFDIAGFKKSLPQHLGFLLANRDKSIYYDDDIAVEFIEQSGITIPPSAHIFAKQFRRSIKNLQEKKK